MTGLASTVVTAAGASPTRWMYVLHGIMGTRANWHTLARQVTRARPAWGAVLLDLRNHGASRGFSPPHTLAAVATDVTVTAESLGRRVDALVGHSYGGKVALGCVEALGGDLDAAVTMDSPPGVRVTVGGSWSPEAVLDALDTLPERYARREDFVTDMAARGFSRGIAQWLAMNLERPQGAGHVVLRVDTVAMRAMLLDYGTRDLWRVVEHPPGRVRLTLVVGGRSEVYDGADRARAAAAVMTAGAGRVTVRTLEDAGHWVHVDAPEAVLETVLAALDG